MVLTQITSMKTNVLLTQPLKTNNGIRSQFLEKSPRRESILNSSQFEVKNKKSLKNHCHQLDKLMRDRLKLTRLKLKRWKMKATIFSRRKNLVRQPRNTLKPWNRILWKYPTWQIEQPPILCLSTIEWLFLTAKKLRKWIQNGSKRILERVKLIWKWSYLVMRLLHIGKDYN